MSGRSDGEAMPIESIVEADSGTHHLHEGQPLYTARFSKVLKFHPPGLAAVSDTSGSYHINLDGTPAYAARFADAFGFYEGLAAVRDADGWFHVGLSGEAIYPQRYAWCGNYQGSRVTVRNREGLYFHLDRDGNRPYAGEYRYAGDYRDGIACVRRLDGLCIHIYLEGRPVHTAAFPDLDVFHKGFARARDARGWFHLRMDGSPAYAVRFAEVEPFYNGQAFCRDWAGRRVVVDERGEVVHVVWEIADGSHPTSKASSSQIVVVVGNCGAGKTTLARSLADAMQVPLVSIDDSRRVASDGSAAGEIRAWQQFLEALRQCFTTDAVIEFSGSGHMAHLVRLTLEEGANYLVVWLRASAEVCQLRAASRPTNVPYPRFGVPVAQLIPELHVRLEREFARGEIWPPAKVNCVDGEASAAAVLSATLAIVKGAR